MLFEELVSYWLPTFFVILEHPWNKCWTIIVPTSHPPPSQRGGWNFSKMTVMEGWEIFIRNGGEARNRWEEGGGGERERGDCFLMADGRPFQYSLSPFLFSKFCPPHPLPPLPCYLQPPPPLHFLLSRFYFTLW